MAIKSVDRIDRLLFLFANRLIQAAAVAYSQFLPWPAEASAAKELENDLLDDVELIRVALANGAERLGRQAAIDVDEYLNFFNIDSDDIDFYKLAYFLCFRLAEEGSFSSAQRKISKIMAVLVLDGFFSTDTDSEIPPEFVKKMCWSIYQETNVEDYGRYGIYSVFKIAAKCAKRSQVGTPKV